MFKKKEIQNYATLKRSLINLVSQCNYNLGIRSSNLILPQLCFKKALFINQQKVLEKVQLQASKQAQKQGRNANVIRNIQAALVTLQEQLRRTERDLLISDIQLLVLGENKSDEEVQSILINCVLHKITKDTVILPPKDTHYQTRDTDG